VTLDTGNRFCKITLGVPHRVAEHNKKKVAQCFLTVASFHITERFTHVYQKATHLVSVLKNTVTLSSPTSSW